MRHGHEGAVELLVQREVGLTIAALEKSDHSLVDFLERVDLRNGRALTSKLRRHALQETLNFEDMPDVLARKFSYRDAAVGIKGDELLRCQRLQGLPQWRARHAKVFA